MNQMTPKVWLSLGALAFVAVLFGLGATGMLGTAGNTTQQASAISSAEAALEDSWDDSAQVVAQMRADIEATYVDANGEIRADWQSIYYDLGTLENQLRAGNEAAFQSLQALILEMSAKIQAEQEL